MSQNIAECSEDIDAVLEDSAKVLKSQIPFQRLYRLDYSGAEDVEQSPPTPTDRMDSSGVKDMEQSTSTPTELWTEEERAILQENIMYFEKMKEVACKATREGPQKLPKRPNTSLQRLFKEKEGKKKRRNEVKERELHNYLRANQVDIQTSISREAFSEDLFSGTSDEKEIVNRLQKGVRNLKRQNAQTMMIYIQFGHFLNLCFDWFGGERKAGRIKTTWAKWLKEKCGYSDDHARKLRALAKVLYGYPQFFTVSLPMNYISNRLNEVKLLLQVPEFALYWKQDVCRPSTNELQQSQ